MRYASINFLSCSSTTRGRTIVTQIGNPVRIFSDRHLELLGHVVDQRCEKVNILDEDVCILHPN